jgi:hypothetical protein
MRTALFSDGAAPDASYVSVRDGKEPLLKVAPSIANIGFGKYGFHRAVADVIGGAA